MQRQYLKIFLNKILFTLTLFYSIINAQDNASVYGFVTDSSKGEALIGANVFINVAMLLSPAKAVVQY